MLSNISADYLITGDSVGQNENVQGVEKKQQSAASIYAKPAEFDDSLEISEEAKQLFQKERDVEFFKSLAMEAPLSTEEMGKIMRLIQEGELIDNKELAEALQQDSDLISYLYSGI